MVSDRELLVTSGTALKPRLLDLFCGGGGASMGYWLAGFEVVGVDIAKQPRYPFTFFQADALEFVEQYGWGFDAIHASPPCQAYSRLAARHPDRDYPDLVGPTRELLLGVGKPYVIENVPEAPLNNPTILCGTMFGLGAGEYDLIRHRAFEMNFQCHPPEPCQHSDRPTISVAGHAGRAGRNGSGTSLERRTALGTPWLAGDTVPEAIPPVYTRWIGHALRSHLQDLNEVEWAA